MVELESGNSQTVNQKSEFYVMGTSAMFYGYSAVLRTCYRTLLGRVEVSGFLKLRLSKRCKKQATVHNVCKFAREYHCFALSQKPIIAFTWGRTRSYVLLVGSRFFTPGAVRPSDGAILVEQVWGSYGDQLSNQSPLHFGGSSGCQDTS